MSLYDTLTDDQFARWTDWLFFMCGVPLPEILELAAADEQDKRRSEANHLFDAWLDWQSNQPPFTC